MGTLGELTIVAAALIVSVVIWTALKAGRKNRDDRDSGNTNLHADRDDHRDSSDGGSDGGGD